MIVGGSVVFFLASLYARRRKLAAAAAAVPKEDPATAFFAKLGDRSCLHTVSVEEAAAVMDTSLAGLRGIGEVGVSADEATRRLQLFGQNALTPPARENHFVMLLRQVFGGLFNIMLWCCVAAELSLALFFGGDDIVTPVVLSVVIVCSGLLQWWTELKAEMMMESLQTMSASPKVRVFRGTATYVEAMDLVPGDIISLEAGDKVPADVRVLKCTEGAEVDNAALTGESVPEPRQAVPDPAACQMLQARSMAFLGTTIVKGRLTCLVVYTGDTTALGDIAQSINKSRTRSSLELQIEHFVHIIAGVAFAVGLLSCVANLLSPMQRSWGRILENSATAFFAQVPEGLLPTVTISLMIAARKMTKRQVLVRKIDAVETLGCVSVLCSDKTGTLTAGEMALTDLVPLPDFAHPETPGASRDRATEMLMECGLLNNAADPHNNTGSPTEVAIMVGMKEIFDKAASAQKRQALDIEKFRTDRLQVFEVPFNSENKWALTVHKMSSASGSGEGVATFRLILKGAPERVVPFCVNAEAEAGPAEEKCAELMRLGRRVLGFAMRDVELAEDFAFAGSSPADANFPFADLHFVGLVGLEDPPKHGIEDAIYAIQRAGVRPVMVTGDHPTTAQAIAERIGIADTGDENTCITGHEISKMLPANGETFDDDKDPLAVQEFWKEVVQHAKIFARVSPSHKQTIVLAYQHYGKCIVAMTGDGVNDAPALKQAEVGVAMGIRGTEVAKEAADIVLLDDNLQSVVAGIEQGRLCSENLRKSILYTLCSKVPQAIPTFAELLGVPTALTVAQVLLIDIGTDIWTAIAFAWQPAEQDLMSVPPRDPVKERIVNTSMLAYSYGYIGVVQSLACWAVFFGAMPKMYSMYVADRHPSEYTPAEVEADYAGMTAYYWTLVLGQVGAALAATTSRSSALSFQKPNWWLTACIVFEILLALLIMFWEPLQFELHTRGLSAGQLACGLVGFALITVLEELRKLWLRTNYPG